MATKFIKGLFVVALTIVTIILLGYTGHSELSDEEITQLNTEWIMEQEHKSVMEREMNKQYQLHNARN